MTYWLKPKRIKGKVYEFKVEKCKSMIEVNVWDKENHVGTFRDKKQAIKHLTK